MTISASGGIAGFSGRQASIHDTAVCELGGITDGTAVLMVMFAHEDFYSTGLLSAYIEHAYDASDLSTAGGEPYASSLGEAQVPGGDNAPGVAVVGAGTSGGRIQFYPSVVNTVAGNPGWALPFGGWPTSPSGDGGDVTWILLPISGFIGAAPSGTAPRMVCAAIVRTVGTSEATTDADTPFFHAAEDFQSVLVLRGALTRDRTQSTAAVDGSELTHDRSDWSTTGSHPTKTPVEYPDSSYLVMNEVTALTGTNVSAGDLIPASSGYYTSSVASEQVMVFTILFGFGTDYVPATVTGIGEEPFEFTHRWPQMGPLLLSSPQEAVDLLERHDQELEQHFEDHGCGPFLYTYRWATFYGDLLAGNLRALEVMELRDRELEEASAHQGELGNQTQDGSCEIQLTHRWPQIIDLVRSGDPRAWDLLEDRDREIEAARSACACVIDTGGGEA